MEWPHGKVVPITDWEPNKYVFVKAPTITRTRAIQYATRQVINKYGVLTIASILVGLLSPRFIRIDFRKDDNSLICSGLVARSWEHGGWTCPTTPFQITPAELAEWGGVT